MKKRVFAALLAAVMVLGMAGCGNQEAEKSGEKSGAQESSQEVKSTSSEAEQKPEEKDPVTIHYWYRNNVGEQQYTGDVEEILNGILKEMEGYEHISIELHPTKDMATEFTLAQADGSQIDLVATYGLDFNTLVSNGDFITLDDLVEKYPDAVSELPEWMVDFGKVNGEQYYIPAYQQAAAREFFIFPDEYLAMYYKETGKTEEDVRAIVKSRDVDTICDFCEEYLLAVRKATGKDTKWIDVTNLASAYRWFNAGQIISGFSSSIFEVKQSEPIYYQLTEEYKKLMQRFNEWYKKGYVHPDYATIKVNDFVKGNFLNDEAYVFAAGYRSAVTEEYAEEYYAPGTGVDLTAIWLSDEDFIISQYAAGGNAIYTECEHPEEAMMIIELLMSKKGEEFYNTLIWGIEGTHWEWADKDAKKIKTLEYDGTQGGSTSTYHAWNWNIGNTFNSWKNQSIVDGYRETILAMHESPDTVVSDLLGITWDMSAVATQISQCTAVDKEYHYQALISADDFESVYNEYMNKLKNAGVEDVKKTLLQQYNEYLAAK